MCSTRLWATPVLFAGALAAAAAARADDPAPAKAKAPAAGPLDRAALDAAAYRSLRDVINQGADLYNDRDWNGCYRLYEGALIALRPLLDHRPKLQQVITEGIDAARATPLLQRRAFVLREVLDKIRAEMRPPQAGVPVVRPDGGPEVPAPVATLWDRLGGEAGVGKVVDDLVAAAGADPKVDFSRGGKYKPNVEELANLRKHLVEFVSEATGGGMKYTGRSMKDAHKGMKITDAQFDAFAADLRKALDKNGVKADDAKAVLEAVGRTRKDVVGEKPAESGPPDVPKGKPDDNPVPPPAGAKTLWERLGGERGVARVVDELYAAAADDPKVKLWGEGNPKATKAEEEKLKRRTVAYLRTLTGGGDPKYDGDLKTTHKSMKITGKQFDAFVDDFRKALEKSGVKADDAAELLAEVRKTRKDIVEVDDTQPSGEKKSGDK